MNLTTAQHAILTHAIDHTGGRINWFPDNIKGVARKKVIDGLVNRALITADGTGWLVAAESYDALGIARPAPATPADAEIEAAVAAAEASFLALKTQPRVRENSKQGLVISMLCRPEGATIAQICEATGWQAGRLAGPYGARHVCRSPQEKAQAQHHIGQGGR